MIRARLFVLQFFAIFFFFSHIRCQSILFSRKKMCMGCAEAAPSGDGESKWHTTKLIEKIRRSIKASYEKSQWMRLVHSHIVCRWCNSHGAPCPPLETYHTSGKQNWNFHLIEFDQRWMFVERARIHIHNAQSVWRRSLYHIVGIRKRTGERWQMTLIVCAGTVRLENDAILCDSKMMRFMMAFRRSTARGSALRVGRTYTCRLPHPPNPPSLSLPRRHFPPIIFGIRQFASGSLMQSKWKSS